MSASDIRTAFLERHIHKVAFVRHGNTAPASVDFDRELTELGREQSRAAGASYGVAELFPFYEGGALCSPAGRCVETADLFLGAASQTLLDSTEGNGGGVPTMPPLELRSQLYDGTMQPEGSRLFKSIGYAPLREYLENPDEKDRDAARSVLGGYAQGAFDAIWDVVSNADAKEDEGAAGGTLLFFAHAIYLVRSFNRM